MEHWLIVIFLFLVVQRLVELLMASRNEKWMKEQGALEVGMEHYKWFVITHSVFFLALLVETFTAPYADGKVNVLLLLVFFGTQLLRVWCISSLGRYWNTKIIILPGADRINKGPYRFIKHPNYIIVAIELIIIPLLFQAYVTAIIFPIIHVILLKIRIPMEEKALLQLVSKE